MSVMFLLYGCVWQIYIRCCIWFHGETWWFAFFSVAFIENDISETFFFGKYLGKETIGLRSFYFTGAAPLFPFSVSFIPPLKLLFFEGSSLSFSLPLSSYIYLLFHNDGINLYFHMHHPNQVQIKKNMHRVC